MDTYLRIRNAFIGESERPSIEFADNAVVGAMRYDLMPSAVTPSLEVIKNAERSLDGTMSVDIIDVKTTLTVTFDVLDNREFEFIMRVFDLKNQHVNYPKGVEAEYFDIKNSGTKKSIECYIDDVSYLPYFTENGIKWRDVKISLIEL